jgi:Fe-S-cluster-containing dehydrogenase component
VNDSTKQHLPVLSEATLPKTHSPHELEAVERAQHGRRMFLQALGAVGAASALGCGTGVQDGGAWEGFFQQHYHRLSDREKQEIFARLEADTLDEYGVDVDIRDPKPMRGVQYGYALNLSACTGCRQCEYACAAENNTSRDPAMHYIRVVELDVGTFDLLEGDRDYEGTVPRPGKVYMPISCQQCENPPCVQACPVNATWRDRDGIVVIDYNWCIGCRYCQAACPYGARHFNFEEPSIRPSEVNPDQGYLSNRLRPAGVMEKCHFCLHRVRRGQLPACQEACPVGARKFGNLLDPNSEIRQVLESKRTYVLKQELGTRPRFYYYFG